MTAARRATAQPTPPIAADTVRRRVVASRWPWGVVWGAACTVVLVSTVLSPIAGVGIAVLVITAMITSRFPEYCCYAAVALGVVTVPAFVPTQFGLAGFVVQLYEPFLFVAALRLRLPVKGSRVPTMSWLFLLGWGALVGVLNATSVQRNYVDLRFQVSIVLVIILAQKVWGTPMVRRCITVVAAALWVSLAVIIVSSVTGLAVAGRADAAVSDAGATRYLTASQYPALAVVCIVVAAAITRRTRLLDQIYLLAPAIAILMLAFSRNHVLAVVVAVLFALLALRSITVLTRFVTGVVLVAAVGAAVVLAVPVFPSAPGAAWMSQQIDAYSTRVIGDSVNLSSDPSNNYRLTEDDAMVAAIATSPVVGHGFGFAYKPAQGPPGQFLHDFAPYYAHNYYLWLLMKGGIVAMVALLTSVIGTVVRGLLGVNRLAVPVVAALVGFLGIIWVVPLPLGSPDCSVLGVLIGLATAAVAGRQRDAGVNDSGDIRLSPTADEVVAAPTVQITKKIDEQPVSAPVEHVGRHSALHGNGSLPLRDEMNTVHGLRRRMDTVDRKPVSGRHSATPRS